MALAMENAQRLAEGDMSNVEFISGPDDAYRRRTILENAYQVSIW